METLKMKTKKYFLLIALLVCIPMVRSQGEPETGTMSAIVKKTFNWEKDGAKIPYQLSILESRTYTAKFDEEDEGKVDQNRVTTPAYVSKLILVESEVKEEMNRLIVLRYEKQVTDTFKLEATPRGFVVNVDDKSMEYIFGEGIYFANTADNDFFVVDEFDYLFAP